MIINSNFCVSMYRVVDDAAPFVCVTVVGNDKKEYKGLFLIDSGSASNVLLTSSNGPLAESIGSNEVKSSKFVTMNNTVVETQSVELFFTMGDQVFRSEFNISNNSNVGTCGDMPIIGILGNVFLQYYSLTIDYSTHQLYKSQISHENFCLDDCDYLFPMEIGLKHFGVPIVPIKGKVGKLVAMVDTGSRNNVFTNAALDSGDIPVNYEGGSEHTIYCLGGETQAKSAVADIVLQGFPMVDEELSEYPRLVEVDIVPMNMLFSNNSKEDDPLIVDAALGSVFASMEGWILDFGAKIVYKSKTSKSDICNV